MFLLIVALLFKNSMWGFRVLHSTIILSLTTS